MGTAMMVLVVRLGTGCGVHVQGSFQDLTHYYDENTIYWPGHKAWAYEIRRFNFSTPWNRTFW